MLDPLLLLLNETALKALLPLIALAAHFAVQMNAVAQSFPAPSRIIYKCEVAGKIAYTDEPCLGAKRLDIEPSRGLSKFSGKEMIGADVQRENHRDMMADALRPIAGLDRQQYGTLSRRINLSGIAKAECGLLDQSIPRAETMEGAASRDTRPAIQRDLLTLRKRFKELGC
jgi:hypothetical protein